MWAKHASRETDYILIRIILSSLQSRSRRQQEIIRLPDERDQT